MNILSQRFPFGAMLTGAQEVPPVTTTGVGVSGISFDPALTTLRVVTAVGQINQVTAAHIHLGRPGQNGPIVAFLFGPSAPTNFGPVTILSDRVITAINLTGPLMGMSLSALIQQIIAGNAYVNVHTVRNPNGEIRGQIVRLQ
ncbi:MAG TPA: CHRD domain-containing protein [Symbiobacteriaceae bacterium]|nr:CHRD domain-containing protein [Symbiobacteriaceae bacterium]